jgi:hypothetical protein
MLEGQKSNKISKKKLLFWICILIIIVNICVIISTVYFRDSNKKKSEDFFTGSQDISLDSQKNSSQGQCFESGIYKIGTDFPAGEYVIVGTGYLKISSDNSGSDASIVEAGNFKNRAIVQVKEGEYFEFEGTAYGEKSVPAVDLSSGRLKDGEYKVGVDFAEGEYKITPHEDSGYYEISDSARGELRNVISSDCFLESKHVTFKNGQYVRLQNLTLELT